MGELVAFGMIIKNRYSAEPHITMLSIPYWTDETIFSVRDTHAIFRIKKMNV